VKMREVLGKGRIEALSDGVFAIVVTLLVLELRVPEVQDAGSVGGMTSALAAMAPKFLSLVISFLTICVIWLNHHRLFTLLDSVDVTFFWLNANLLLWVSVIPFPTALIGDYPSNSLALSFYGIVMALMAAAFVFMRLHMQKTPCFHPDVDQTEFRVGTKLATLFGPVAYLTGALASWLWAPLAFAVYLGIPVYFVLPHAVRARSD
jgi:uncharacterized membrane protein